MSKNDTLNNLKAHDGQLLIDIIQNALSKLAHELQRRDTTNNASLQVTFHLKNERGVVCISPSIRESPPDKILVKTRVRISENGLIPALTQVELDLSSCDD